MDDTMEYTELSNGAKMPMLGHGVFQIDDKTTERFVADALDTDRSVCYDHTDLTVVGGLLGFIKSTM